MESLSEYGLEACEKRYGKRQIIYATFSACSIVALSQCMVVYIETDPGNPIAATNPSE